jgi:membrane protein
MLSDYRQIVAAIYRLYQNSGFSMAGSVAFSFIVSLFPFCIFLGALASVFGGRPLAAQAVAQLFAVMPKGVAEALAPQVEQIMGESRAGLLTLSGLLALFFATNANETLRSALNGAYRITETRPYLYCLSLSALFLLLTALAMLVVTWVLVVGPNIVSYIPIPALTALLDSSALSTTLRYLLAGATLAVYLIGVHLWLAAGERGLADVWPGVLLTIVLMLGLAALYSTYIALGNYAAFYAGLSQIMVALIFFQLTGVAILLGAELNRGIMEFSRIGLGGGLAP